MSILRKLAKSHPARIFLTIILTIYFYNYLPLTLKQVFLALSLSLKEVLMLMIPFIIFSSVYNAFSKIRGNALYFIFLLLGCIILSNFFSVTIAGIFSYFLIFTNESGIHAPRDIMELQPLWQFTIPRLIPNNIVLVLSLLLACINKPFINKNIGKAAKFTAKIVDIFLKKFFTPLLPIFISGFLVKLLTDDIIGDVLSVNPKAFLFMIITMILYLVLVFLAAIYPYKLKASKILRNILAPAITSFSSMSSAAALPFSIKAAEDNTGNKNVADVVMPATSNTHMIGDSICIPILAMILLLAFGHPMPSLYAYFIFALTFVITKFSGAGIPGGSILIMIPVLESCLGFTPEMVALITICYMLLDPITSTGNVIGNNIFVIHFNKLYLYIDRKLKKK
jgi:Na+/H+-dicarboxylate symporter